MAHIDGGIAAIIPARDEEDSILAAVGNARAAGARTIHMIVNGSTDRTAAIALAARSGVHVHEFREALGLDVPRAVGAALCLACGGFMGLPAGAALALNSRLGVSDSIGISSPSHGPSACSIRLLRSVEPRDFATPPVLLARAVLGGLRAGVGVSLRHDALGSPYRGEEYARLVADTIIGDCAEAIAVFKGDPRTRELDGHEYSGLNPNRRFDVLDSVVRSILAQAGTP